MLKPKVSELIQYRLPDWLSDKTQFVSFIKYYYEWLEKEGEPLDFIRNLVEYGDIDESTNAYIDLIVGRVISFSPADAVIDRKLLVKNVKEFVRSKGSDESLNFIMKAIYGEEAYRFNMSEFVLRSSDNEYNQDGYVSIQVEDPVVNDFSKCVGANLVQTVNNSSAKIEDTSYHATPDGRMFFVLKFDPRYVNGTFSLRSEVRAMKRTADPTFVEITSYQTVLNLDVGTGVIRFLSDTPLQFFAGQLILKLGGGFRGVVSSVQQYFIDGNNKHDYSIYLSYTGTTTTYDEVYFCTASEEDSHLTKLDFAYGMVSESIGEFIHTNNGSGYFDGMPIELRGGSGAGCVAAIGECMTGGVDSVIVIDGGKDYAIGDPVEIAEKESGGYGFDAVVSNVDGFGGELEAVMQIDSINIDSGGYGYSVGDTLLIKDLDNQTPQFPIQLTVSSVASVLSGSEVINSFKILNSGRGYRTARYALFASADVTLTGTTLTTNANTITPLTDLAVDYYTPNNKQPATYALNQSLANYADSIVDVKIKTVPPAGLDNVSSYLVFNGFGASIIASKDPNVINSIALTDTGSGYVSAPTVTITTSTGSGAVLEPEMLNGKVVALYIRDGGTGYTTGDTIVFTGGTPTVVAAASIISVVSSVGGSITRLSTQNAVGGKRGYNYVDPVINILDSSGVGAIARAVKNSNGEIISAQVIYGGTGYSASPTTQTYDRSGEGFVAQAICATTTQGAITGFNTLIGGYKGEFVSLPESSENIPYVPVSTTGNGAKISLTYNVKRLNVLNRGTGYIPTFSVPNCNVLINADIRKITTTATGGFSRVKPGMYVSGTGIAARSQVFSVDSDNQITVTKDTTTATGTTITFDANVVVSAVGIGSGLDLFPVIGGSGALENVVIISQGNNYPANSMITFSSGGGYGGASALLKVKNGKIVEVDMLTYGSGYDESNFDFTVNAVGSGAWQAPVDASVLVEGDGKILYVDVISGGHGYDSSSQLFIEGSCDTNAVLSMNLFSGVDIVNVLSNGGQSAFTVSTAGTWAATGTTTVTVTGNAHGFVIGDFVNLVFTRIGGATNATNGNYLVTWSSSNTFEVINIGGSITGNGTVKINDNWKTITDPSNVVQTVQYRETAIRGGSSGKLAYYVDVNGSLATYGKDKTPWVWVSNAGSGYTTDVTASWEAVASSTVSCIYNNHGMANGDFVTMTFSKISGTNASSGNYLLSNVSTNTFEITNTGGSITGQGNVVLNRLPNVTIGNGTGVKPIIKLGSTKRIASVDVISGGSGYNANTFITVIGSGVDCVLQPRLDGSTGISSATVLLTANTNRNYTTYPKIIVDDTSLIGKISEVKVINSGNGFRRFPLLKCEQYRTQLVTRIVPNKPNTIVTEMIGPTIDRPNPAVGANLLAVSNTIGGTRNIDQLQFGYGYEEIPEVLYPMVMITNDVHNFKIGESVSQVGAGTRNIGAKFISAVSSGATLPEYVLVTVGNVSSYEPTGLNTLQPTGEMTITLIDSPVGEGIFAGQVITFANNLTKFNSALAGKKFTVTSVNTFDNTFVVSSGQTIPLGTYTPLIPIVDSDMTVTLKTAKILQIDHQRNMLWLSNVDNVFNYKEELEYIAEGGAYEGRTITTEYFMQISDHQKIIGHTSGAIATILWMNRAASLPIQTSMGKTKKYFTSNKGMISKRGMRMINSKNIQDYSLEVHTGLSVDTYGKLLKETVHPAGYYLSGVVEDVTDTTLDEDNILTLSMPISESGRTGDYMFLALMGAVSSLYFLKHFTDSGTEVLYKKRYSSNITALDNPIPLLGGTIGSFDLWSYPDYRVWYNKPEQDLADYTVWDIQAPSAQIRIRTYPTAHNCSYSITGSTINITAPDHGLKAGDGFIITDAVNYNYRGIFEAHASVTYAVGDMVFDSTSFSGGGGRYFKVKVDQAYTSTGTPLSACQEPHVDTTHWELCEGNLRNKTLTVASGPFTNSFTVNLQYATTSVDVVSNKTFVKVYDAGYSCTYTRGTGVNKRLVTVDAPAHGLIGSPNTWVYAQIAAPAVVGSYTVTGPSDTVTITLNGHGYSNGDKVTLNFMIDGDHSTESTPLPSVRVIPTSGTYIVSGSATNTFTITNPTSIATITGNVVFTSRSESIGRYFNVTSATTDTFVIDTYKDGHVVNVGADKILYWLPQDIYPILDAQVALRNLVKDQADVDLVGYTTASTNMTITNLPTTHSLMVGNLLLVKYGTSIKYVTISSTTTTSVTFVNPGVVDENVDVIFSFDQADAAETGFDSLTQYVYQNYL